ncbi:hypothetical protein V1J52_19805 [Streptomyces sp. TRM 70351]|uniref:hypothetical protein n=1 Tax=Streptomyces sp. TRM 70351 TaxID=3116552 RepID=UPI002E7BC55E|nr:hypothetical protein [Streptomyces sp. TRM 70351]MEE1930400.1 hypothetical protein [Streptomyces sp. TRM 70351]
MCGLSAGKVLGAALLATVALTGCTAGDGLRMEESVTAPGDAGARATPLPAASATPSPGGTASAAEPAPSGGPEGAVAPEPTAAAPVSPPGARGEVEVVSLLRRDPQVSAEVRRQLRPCTEDGGWPVDVAYGRLTGNGASDLVVNVSNCSDGKGAGSYVYHQEGDGDWRTLYAAASPGVYAAIEEDHLTVRQEVRLDGDARCCPSGEDTLVFAWKDGGFVEVDRSYREFPDPTEGRADGED